VISLSIPFIFLSNYSIKVGDMISIPADGKRRRQKEREE
jgi:hypothetical protein